MKRRKIPSNSKLEAYRAKRSPGATPEPFHGVTPAGSGLFVVQKHAASHLHYDLRLEIGGVLVSWAVPKGPSADPEQKRLAMHVEDHPLEYGGFEGVIPEGNYGAGSVILWDRGHWTSLEGDAAEGVVKGKLLFDLHGYKLRGRWTLFRTGKNPQGREWLLMKKPDAEADPDKHYVDTSILSGLPVESIAEPGIKQRSLMRDAKRWNAAAGMPDAAGLDPMLARAAPEPFDGKPWLFEIKYDGYRLFAVKQDGRTWLRYRKGGDATARFPEIAAAVEALPFDPLIVDGELVALDATGRPSFGLLQARISMSSVTDVRRAAVRQPVTLFAFDLPAACGFDLRGLTLERRKACLRHVVPEAGPLRFSDHIPERGKAVFAQIQSMGLEGVVAKRKDSTYVSGRSDAWLKLRSDRVGDFVVLATKPESNGRGPLGSLHVAQWDGEHWAYAGSVGSGLDGATRKRILAAVDPAPRPDDLRDDAALQEADFGDATWVAPRLVVEVRFKERTRAGRLRHPVFLRLRDDKQPEECVDDRIGAPATRDEPKQVPLAEPSARELRPVSQTNRDKIFWPEDGLTKGDLIDFYEAVAPAILPYLEDRPVVLTRYPDGIHGKNFYQKDAPGFQPEWVRTESVWSGHTEREIHYFVCDNVETLIYLANLGSIPLHVWSSRVETLQHPDWCILDLDPKGAPFEDVIRIAKEIHRLCDQVGLPNYVKTSGSSGLHVLIPLGRLCTYDQSRSLAEVLARLIVAALPEIATVNRNPRAREGKVYVDFLQNRHGQLLVAPFSVRPLPGAPVSTPLRWSEVRKGLRNEAFTVRNVPQRVARQRNDPFAALLTQTPDLGCSLEKLADLMDS